MYLPPPKPFVPKTAWFLGLDLAQRRDFTALAVLELHWDNKGRDPVTYSFVWEPSLIIRSLDRFELGRSYIAYAEAVQDSIEAIRAHDALSSIHLALDAAGPGAPIVDEFRVGFDARIHPITITGGAFPSHSAHGANVPRRALISRTLLLMERGVLQAPQKLKNWGVLCEELLRLKAGDSHSTAHDDLAIALTLAAWQAAVHSPELLPAMRSSTKPMFAGARRLL